MIMDTYLEKYIRDSAHKGLIKGTSDYRNAVAKNNRIIYKLRRMKRALIAKEKSNYGELLLDYCLGDKFAADDLNSINRAVNRVRLL
jgi:hypothetical protein